MKAITCKLELAAKEGKPADKNVLLDHLLILRGGGEGGKNCQLRHTQPRRA